MIIYFLIFQQNKVKGIPTTASLRYKQNKNNAAVRYPAGKRLEFHGCLHYNKK
jgi:hypothetical protein